MDVCMSYMSYIITFITYKMSEATTYYQRNRDKTLNRLKDCYKYNKRGQEKKK